MSDLDGIIKRLRNLPQYKNHTDEQLKAIAENRGAALDLDVESLFSDREDRRLAKELLDKYLADYNVDTISDKNLLRQLIYLEVFHITHLQRSANEFNSSAGNIPLQLVDALHKNINQIVALKEKLGLTKDFQSDALEVLDLLKKKAKIWRDSNQASRTLVCPHCGKLTLLKIRTDIWEAQKHPYFKDRLLGNETLIKLYKEQRLTKEDIASILEVSTDYIEWLITKWSLIDKKEDSSTVTEVKEDD